MFSHITVGTNNLAESREFYADILACLGSEITYQDKGYVQYGPKDGRFPHFFVFEPIDGRAATWGNGFSLEFVATSTGRVSDVSARLAEFGTSITAEDDCISFFDPTGNQICVRHNPRVGGDDFPLFSSASFGSADLSRDANFYESVLKTLGVEMLQRDEADQTIEFGRSAEGAFTFKLRKPKGERPASWGNGSHIAFWADTRKEVHAFFDAAMSSGAISVGDPGPRPNYSPRYYAAYMLDLNGNKIQAVTREEV